MVRNKIEIEKKGTIEFVQSCKTYINVMDN
jgi:hypothetical protein